MRARIMELQAERTRQLTIKIKPFSHRPNLLSEVPQVNSIGVGQGAGRKKVRLHGGDIPAASTSETDWFWPSSGFSANGATMGSAGEEDTTMAQVEGRDKDRCGF